MSGARTHEKEQKNDETIWRFGWVEFCRRVSSVGITLEACSWPLAQYLWNNVQRIWTSEILYKGHEQV